MSRFIAKGIKEGSKKRTEGEHKVTSLYALDLGNGFTKRIFNGNDVITEPSVFAEVPRVNGSERHFYSLDNRFHYFVGNDVIDVGLEPDVAVNGRERYFTENYKRMLLGFIASDFKEYDTVEIPILILGVPNTDHEAISEKMENFYSGKFIVTVDNHHQLTIDVKICVVLPQPLGTYVYAVSQGIVEQWGDHVLVCDSGTGSFDVASIKGDTIVHDDGETLGSLDAYMDIRKYLIKQHGNLSSITVENMPSILKNGLRKDGVATLINEDPNVQKILKVNFDKMYRFLEKNKFDFDKHTATLWTGGTSLLHRERIVAKGKQTFHVLENAQEANVRGFYAVAQDIYNEGDPID